MSFEEMLKKLKVEYVASLPEKMTAIESHIANSAVSDLRDAFHKLKGTGKTYGVPELSELSAVIEQICLKGEVTRAVKASQLGVSVIKDIFKMQSQEQALDLNGDPRFAAIKAL
jgi:HPt (histidine-containing phosphotransfer) domain-containing protein